MLLDYTDISINLNEIIEVLMLLKVPPALKNNTVSLAQLL